MNQNLEQKMLKATEKVEQIGNVFLIFQSLAVRIVCFPALRCTPIVVTDQIESVDEEGAKVEGVGCMLETEALCLM